MDIKLPNLQEIRQNREYIKLIVFTIGICFLTVYISSEFIVKPVKQQKEKLILDRELYTLLEDVHSSYQRLKTIEHKLPENRDASWLIETLTQFSKSVEIDILSMTPLETKNFNPYKYIPVKLEISTRFPKLVEYITLIDENSDILFIESLKIKRGSYRQYQKRESKNIDIVMVVGYLSK